MGISIVIPTWEGRALLERLFASLATVHFSEADEIIVADGNSSDGTQEFVRAVAEESSLNVKLVALYDNFGFSGNVNAGLQEANPENDVVILNNDVVITMTVTAYTSYDGGMRGDGITTSGLLAQDGFCACGPSYEFGTAFAVFALGRVFI